MAVDLGKARNFVYRNGTLLERALFAWLFEGGSLERLAPDHPLLQESGRRLRAWPGARSKGAAIESTGAGVPART